MSGSRTTFTTAILSVVGSGFFSLRMAFTLVRCPMGLAVSDLFTGLFWWSCKKCSCPPGNIWWPDKSLFVSLIRRRDTCFLALLVRRRPIRLAWRLPVFRPASSSRFGWHWRLFSCFLDCFEGASAHELYHIFGGVFDGPEGHAVLL